MNQPLTIIQLHFIHVDLLIIVLEFMNDAHRLELTACLTIKPAFPTRQVQFERQFFLIQDLQGIGSSTFGYKFQHLHNMSHIDGHVRH